MITAKVLMAGFASSLVFAFSAMAANSGRAGVGTVEFTEGDVLLNGKALASNLNAFPVMAPNDSLRTVNVRREPFPWIFSTTPSKTWVRRRFPSTTWKWTLTRSPTRNSGTCRS